MTMIEKICIAMCKEEGIDPHAWFNDNFGWMSYEHLAIAAVKAMSEPTGEMVEAGYDWYDRIDATEDSPMPKGVFRTMIDAALKEVEA